MARISRRVVGLLGVSIAAPSWLGSMWFLSSVRSSGVNDVQNSGVLVGWGVMV